MFSPWVAQLVEQATDNRWVIGSTPVPRTKFASVAEMDYAPAWKAGEEGSLPSGCTNWFDEKIFSSNVKKVVYKLFALCYNYSIKTNKATLMNKDTEAFDMETITSQWYWRSVRQANRQVKPRCEVVLIKTAADTVTAKNNVLPFVKKAAWFKWECYKLRDAQNGIASGC